MSRKNIPKDVETKVLTATRRRCPLCYFLLQDSSVKKGQIAHLNKNREDHRYDNLVWLCFDHHSEFDSTTSQHKNYTKTEVKSYRDKLTHIFQERTSNNDPKFVFDDELKINSLCFNGVNAFANLKSEKFPTLRDFYIRLKYKITIKKYNGTILTLLDSNNTPILYAKYYNAEDSNHSNQLVLFTYQNGTPIKMCAIQVDNDWNELFISVSNERVIFKNNTAMTYSYNKLEISDFDRVQFSSICFENKKYDFLRYQLRTFAIVDKTTSMPVYNFNFEYGEAEFLTQNNSADFQCFNFHPEYKYTD